MGTVATGRQPAGLRARLAAALALALSACALAAPAADAASDQNRYTLVHGCFALKSVSSGDYVVKAGGGYDVTAASPGAAEPFRMQATDLGSYLLYGAAQDFLGRTVLNGTTSAASPSDTTDWTVDADGGAFRITNGGRDLAVGGLGGTELTTVAAGGGGDAARFEFDDAAGCADYPEVDINVTGGPGTSSPNAPVRGFVETHMHQMAFEFLGGRAHCGRPWHRFGAPYALRDCADHEASGGCGAILETVLSGSTCHGAGGWPDFGGWPTHQQLTHEQSYYRWLERSWRGGMRVFVNLLVENRVLCAIYPIREPGYNCNEMDTVRRQAQRMRELERYIDAQSGGPGEGWYRIVESPAEARQVIADGKLAVVMGMEVSEPFNCRLMQPGDVPTCTDDSVADGLDELYELGVRQLELINKFDNGIAGVAGDSGSTGTITNSGNFLSAGRFWDLKSCNEPVNHDHSPAGLQHNDDELIANGLLALLPGGTLPVYGPPPHCNQMGLTPLGEEAVQGIIDRGMILDPDHMSVLARNKALDIIEDNNYGGITTSHSWSTDNALPRISSVGGLIGPMAGTSQGFVDKWRHLRNHGYDTANKGLFGLGKGADMNGFASQGGPRTATAEAPAVSYPFQSFDGSATIHQQVSGTRTFDINTDGVAHYGLYPDWVEDVRILGGDEIVDDLANGAEAYLQMWERATGERPPVHAPSSGPAGNQPKGSSKAGRCKALRKKLKRAKSKKAKRKLRRKLRRKGC